MSTPLNPDGIEAARNMFVFMCAEGFIPEDKDVVKGIVSAYLAVAQPVVNSAELTLNGLRANFEWGGQIHNDPAEFDRVINQVRAQALIDLADQMRDKFTASWIRRKAREYTHGPHKPVGAFAIPEEKSNGDQDL